MLTDKTFAEIANEEGAKLCAKPMIQARGLSPKVCAAVAKWVESSTHFSNPFEVLPIAFVRVETLSEAQLRDAIRGEIYNTAMAGR